ncbi:DUF4238 domain-containing protein [Corynebacterium casei]|uniref:DUF4238 domain-containing protein n=1 Tax=Corynebacterium casei LMG S-19264 TaxID=1285583 RepID=A0ABN4CE30_9CORY|nr:DUF4238 domain-containing protein [Corynebacterium casei]AHI19558.1 hypothetical protein CCASEI_04900 [Corynebacterium casei LMG S-19264]
MSKPAKRHHLIPKFYLKAFALEGNICVQELGGGSYTISASKAFSVNDYYRNSESLSVSPLEFEEHLSVVESNAADALRRLESQRYIGRKGKADIAEFLLAQWVRGEDFRLASNDFNNMAIRDMARRSPEDGMRLFHELSFGQLVSDDEWSSMWESYLRDEGPRFLTTVENSFSQLKGFTKEPYKALLLIRRWTVLFFNQPVLVSGDRPVVLADLKRITNSVVSLGLANTPQIIFPVNRRMALVLELVQSKESIKEMIERLQSVDWVVGTENQGEEINRLIALNSRERIFGHPLDNERLRKLSSQLKPIRSWESASDWSEATLRLTKLKNHVVDLFHENTRDELAEMLEKRQSSGGRSGFLFQGVNRCNKPRID